MTLTVKLSTALAALALIVTALAGCAATEDPPVADPAPTSTADPAPTPTYLTELPAWALDSIPWIIYPEGFKCTGTEGCGNDYHRSFGEPGPVLPAHVEYYDPAKHDCVAVFPLGVDCRGHHG